MQRVRVFDLIFVQGLRRVCDSPRSPGQREDRGDERGCEARAADCAPGPLESFAAFFVFAFRGGVVHRDPRIGIRVGGDIGNGALFAASDRFPVGGALLPDRSGERNTAAASAGAVAIGGAFACTAVVPDGLARPRSTGAERAQQAGTSHRNHVWGGGGIVGEASFFFVFGVPVQVAVVSRRRCDDDAGLFEGACAVFFRRHARRGPAPGVRDLRGAEPGSRFLGFFEVFERGRVGLDEHDLAALAGCVGDLDVERYLFSPSIGFFHFLASRFPCFLGFFGHCFAFADRFFCFPCFGARGKGQVPCFPSSG